MTSQATRDLAAIRRALRFDQWDKLGECIARARRQPFQGFSPWGLVDELRQQSIVRLPVATAAADDMRRYFEGEKSHEGAHVYTGGSNFSHYRLDTILRCPGLIDLLNNDDIIGLVHAYLGCVPVLYSVNAWWSHVAAEPQGDYQQRWHRDTDDFRFVTLFLQLTDVDEESGPFQIIKGSHAADPEVGSSMSAQAFSATGPAGTMWLANTIALHRGLLPKTRPRLMVWARYGFGENSNSMDLEQGPIARERVVTSLTGTARDRHVNRLLFDWGVGPI